MTLFTPGKEEAPARTVLSVSQLNRQVRLLLEDHFPAIWVEGEISNLALPASGHWYFTLKDEAAQIRCAMFRNKNRGVRFKPDNGQHVLLRARISIYEGRGDYQLIVEALEDVGDGALRRAYEMLRARLQQEGLFAIENKKPIPVLPQRIGILTSPTGAAVRDVLSILKRRFPAIPVLIYPIVVQGEEAVSHITQMLALANARKECDVLLLVRGGGSLEDLHAFNDERVARAVFDSEIPIVTGIGHEVDFTIADFVADQRAATPSAAAELVSPNQLEWLSHWSKSYQQLARQINNRYHALLEKLKNVERRLQHQHPGTQLQQRSQRLDELDQRLIRAQRQQVQNHSLRFNHLLIRLGSLTPSKNVARMQANLERLQSRLCATVSLQLERKRQNLATLGRTLTVVSPLATLDRGYAITKRKKDKQVVSSVQQVTEGESIETLLADGSIESKISKIRQNRNLE